MSHWRHFAAPNRTGCTSGSYTDRGTNIPYETILRCGRRLLVRSRLHPHPSGGHRKSEPDFTTGIVTSDGVFDPHRSHCSRYNGGQTHRAAGGNKTITEYVLTHPKPIRRSKYMNIGGQRKNSRTHQSRAKYPQSKCCFLHPQPALQSRHNGWVVDKEVCHTKRERSVALFAVDIIADIQSVKPGSRQPAAIVPWDLCPIGFNLPVGRFNVAGQYAICCRHIGRLCAHSTCRG